MSERRCLPEAANAQSPAPETNMVRNSTQKEPTTNVIRQENKFIFPLSIETFLTKYQIYD